MRTAATRATAEERARAQSRTTKVVRMIIGEGKTQNYTALLLFLAGMVAAGVAVYYSLVGGRWAVPTALALLLMLAGAGFVAVKKEDG